MHHQPKLVIALAADIRYETYVITLIKSLCYHHSHLRIYLLHKTFPNEWFDAINKRLSPLNSEVVSVYVYTDFSEYTTASHITETTFYRFLIPHLPEKIVLYLDCDIVVNGDLYELFQIPFDDYPLIAVEDFVLNNIPHNYLEYPDMKPYFNAGVLMFNIPIWQRENLSEELVNRLKTHNMLYADQDILNSLLCKCWKAVSYIYNFQTDAIHDFSRRQLENIVEEKGWLNCDEPKVIHYTSPRKPWTIEQDILFREKYWFYYQLSWQEIMEIWGE